MTLTEAALNIRTRSINIPMFFNQIAYASVGGLEQGMLSEYLYKTAEYIRSLHEKGGQDHPALYAFFEAYKPLHETVTHFLIGTGITAPLHDRLTPALLAHFRKSTLEINGIAHIL